MRSNARKLVPAVVLGIIAIVVVGGLFWRQSTLRATAVEVPVAVVADDQAAATDPVATTSPRSSRQGVAPRASFSRADREKLVAERNRERKQMSDRVDAANAALAARHRAEKVDSQWSADMESRLQEVSRMSGFEEAGAVPTTLDIDCKATTCKIDAGLASRGQGDDWAMLYMSSVGSNIKRAYTSVITAPDGTSQVVIYAIAR